MAHKSAKLTTEELHEVKHLMGAALSLLSFWSLLSLDMQSGWLIVPAMGAILVALIHPAVVNRIPAKIWRVAGPVLLIIIGADFLLHVPDFIPSLVRMMVWILLYRNLAPRRQREDLQLILLCLFCLVLSGVMTVSLLFAFQILLFTPLAMALLFVISLLDRGEQSKAHQLTWADFKWWRLIRRVGAVLDWRVLSLGAFLFGFVVLVTTLLFILTPRFDLNQAIPFMRMETKALTGFSEEVKLGDVSSVQNDNSVAMRIDLPSREALAANLYWRMLVLDRYEDGLFSMSNGLRNFQFRETMTVRELRSDRLPAGQRKGELWTFYLEGGVSRYLPVPGDYAVLRFQKQQEIELYREPRLYSLDRVGQSVFSYQIEDLSFKARFPSGDREWQGLENARLAEGLDDPDYPLTTLEINLGNEDRATLAEINRRAFEEHPLSASDYSAKVIKMLGDRFDYSLSPDGQLRFPGAPDAPDPVVHWLREGSRGHCELFAGAFTLLAREAGYPARLVVGFMGGSWNSVEDYFVLRNRDAHAWVEIFDREAQEWLRVDPTPGNHSSAGAAAFGGGLRFETGLTAWVDSLRILWYRRIVNFEQKDQIEMALSLRDMIKSFSEDFTERAKAAMAELKTWLAQPFQSGYLLLAFLVVCLALLFYVIWRVRYLAMGIFFRLLRHPKALDPVRRQASRYLKRLRRVHGDKAALPVISELQALRFGPEVRVEQAKAVFARARQAMRQKP